MKAEGWINLEKQKPQHKDQVLCSDGDNILPATYFNNMSFEGFYFFTTQYSTTVKTPYTKVRLKDKHKIENVIMWKPLQ